jgi:hypothetical protein
VTIVPKRGTASSKMPSFTCGGRSGGGHRFDVSDRTERAGVGDACNLLKVKSFSESLSRQQLIGGGARNRLTWYDPV